MAGGYLGKISAVISANTGDYVRKLGESAKETTNFARTVERTLSRASSEAAKSLQSIYTPLQQFERALRAAASERLSFKGFDGAIRTVEELKKRLAGIKASDVDIVVKASGQKTLTDLRNVINEISSKDIDIFRNVGGLAGLQKARADIVALTQLKDVVVKPKVSLEQIDRLIAKFSQIDDTQINAVIRVFGERELDAALTKARQTRDVFESVTQPLEGARQAFTQLASQVQGAFIPALARAQDEAQDLASAFTADKFAAAQQTIASLTRRINELSQAQKLASSVPTGGELQFRDPGLNRSLTRASRAGTALMALPSSPFSGGQDFSELASELSRVSSEAVVAKARFDGLQEVGAGWATQAGVEYRRVQDELDAVIAKVEKTVRAFKILDEEAALGPNLGRASDLVPGTRRGNPTGEFGPPLPPGPGLRIRREEDALGPNLGRTSPFFPGNGRGNPTGTFGPTLPPGFGGSPDAGLGASIADSQRQLDVLRGAIVSVKSQLDTLPAGVRAQFIPAIQDADNEFRRLAASGISASSDEIEQAARRVDALAAASKRAAAAQSNFSTTVGDAFETSQIDSYRAKLKLLQDILIANGVSSGDAAEEVNNLADALRRVASTRGGFLDPRAQEGLRMQEQAAARAVAAAAPGAGGERGVIERLKRAGDVGRAGFDKFSLAAQQAGFAIDDFLSSTGGLDQKLRAVSNNITQLAFILGGTNGLFIGLGAVIGGQVASAIVKFANGGKTAEDQANALNEALARQKSLVQELAQAFESLGEAISRRAFSQPSQRAKEFEDELTRLEKKQKELRDGRASASDPRVQRERAEQARIERELKTETNAGRRVALEQQLRASRASERAAVQAAATQRPSQDDIVSALNRAADRQFSASTRGEDTVTRSDAETLVRQRQRASAAQGAADPFQTLQLLRQQRDELVNSGLSQGILGDNAVAESIRELETLIQQLEVAANAAADALSINFLRSINAAAGELETAQGRVAQAIEAAVPSAVGLQATLDTFAKQIATAEQRIRDSIENEDLTAEDRKAIVERAEKEIADARIKREEATAKAAELAFQRIVDPRSLLENVIGRSQQSLQDSGFGEGRIARDLRVLEAQRQDLAARLNERPDDALTRGVVQSGLEAINQQAAALEAATLALRAFGEALNSIAQSAAQDVGSLQQRAEQARRDDIRFGTPETAQRRSQAEADLRAGREAQRQVENSVQNARDRAEQQIVDNGTRLGERLRQIDEQLAVPAGQVSTTGVQGGTLEDRQRLRQERARLQAQADAAVENDPFVREARFRRDRLTRQAEAAAGADRGRQIGMTDAQRAIEQTQAQLADVRDRAGQMFQPGQANQDVADFLRQSRENLGREVAPAIFSMADQVMNAALQGPSRAALTAADVNTSQGAAELNRLLRGDDPNRNANIVELQKQNTTLTAINQGIQQMADNMGIVLDL